MIKVPGFIVCLLACLVGCSSTPEQLGEVGQAVAPNYNILAIELARSHFSFDVPLPFGNHPGGGLAEQISRISRNVVVPTIDYNWGANSVPAGAVSCNGDVVHDSKAVMAYGCGVLQSLGANLSNYQALWLMPPSSGNDISECNLSIGFGGKASDQIPSACGVSTSVATIFNVMHDGSTSFGQPSLEAFGLIHELLHGLSATTSSHNGYMYCTSGLARSINPSCTIEEDGGVRSFLNDISNSGWLHYETMQEPSVYQDRAGWLPSASNKFVTFNGPGTSAHITLNAVDSSTLTYPIGAKIMRANNRFIFFEHHAQQWIGGCPTNGGGAPGSSPSAPCGSVNRPGVYAWVSDETPNTTTAPGHLYELRWASTLGTTLRGFAPLPVTTNVTIETGVVARVLSSGANSSVIQLIVQ